MYSHEIVMRIKSATPWVGELGNSGTKVHGLTVKGNITVTDPQQFFGNIGLGKPGKHINAILNDELPIKPPFLLKFSERKLLLTITEPIESACTVDCTVEEITTSAVEVDHLNVEIELKCTGMNHRDTGKVANLKGELMHGQLDMAQGEIFPETIEIKVQLQAAPPPETNTNQGSIFDAETCRRK